MLPLVPIVLIGGLLYMASQAQKSAASTADTPDDAAPPSAPDTAPDDDYLPPPAAPETPDVVSPTDNPDDPPPVPEELATLPDNVQTAYLSNPYHDDIRAAAIGHNVPLPILVAVGWQESRLNPDAPDGAAGEVGMFQITPHTAGADMGYTAEQLRDPRTNIVAASTFLAMKYRQHGSDWGAAVKAYNGTGPRADAYAAAVLSTAGMQA